MIEIARHVVTQLIDRIRFIDYAIGVFPQLMTKNSIKKALKRNELIINDSLANSAHWMELGDVICLVDPCNRIPKPFPLDIEVIFEDDYLVIVNKPSGLPTSGNFFRTLENAIVGKIRASTQVDALKWARPVHRLDAATSGLLILSKTATAHRILAKSFENKKVKKKYHAIVAGNVSEKLTQINTAIDGQYAMTELKFLDCIPSLRSEFMTLIELSPKTGRTHQLRIHCSEEGHSIVGDTLYGEKGNTLLHKGLYLTATQLEFPHPVLNKFVKVEIEMPNRFFSLLEREERRWRKFNKEQI
tara:strand:- start:10813 stop:11715 length:903 start_codon:yes stop_codon:yes gene_type:complete